MKTKHKHKKKLKTKLKTKKRTKYAAGRYEAVHAWWSGNVISSYTGQLPYTNLIYGPCSTPQLSVDPYMEYLGTFATTQLSKYESHEIVTGDVAAPGWYSLVPYATTRAFALAVEWSNNTEGVAFMALSVKKRLCQDGSNPVLDPVSGKYYCDVSTKRMPPAYPSKVLYPDPMT